MSIESAIVERARAKVAAFIGADPSGVVFTKNATEAFNLLAYSYAEPLLGAGDIVLTTQMEHHANLVPWQLAAQRGTFELRHVLAVSAWVARMPGPRAVGCVHVVERLGRRGRLNMLRAARMMLAGTTGELHLQFLSEKGRDGYARRTGARKPLDPAVVAAEVAESGGRILEESRSRVSSDADSSQVCRMIIDWNA